MGREREGSGQRCISISRGIECKFNLADPILRPLSMSFELRSRSLCLHLLFLSLPLAFFCVCVCSTTRHVMRHAQQQHIKPELMAEASSAAKRIRRRDEDERGKGLLLLLLLHALAVATASKCNHAAHTLRAHRARGIDMRGKRVRFAKGNGGERARG